MRTAAISVRLVLVLLPPTSTPERAKELIVGRVHDRQRCAIALQQGSSLSEKVNVEISKFIEKGRFDMFFQKWFGSVP